MTKQEQIEIIINKSCNENAIAISEVEVGIIALDLLKSGLIAFDNEIPVADIGQGATFKWGKKEYIKLDTISEGCLCLAKDAWFNSEFSCCDGEMCKDALNLITEQEQEIDRLKAENEELTKVVSSKVYDLIDNTKEIADARETWEKQAKIDVLNELKAKSYVNDYCREVVELEKIDELIKEAQND